VILADVNVLLYAFRRDSDDHERYRDWLHDRVNGREAYGVSPQVLSSLVRISTHPRIYRQPSTVKEARAFCRALLDRPQATIVTPQERHWSIFESLCREADARGNLVQNAWFAALAIEWGCEWLSVDRDYARFAGLRWSLPF
jgi:toxin-antitoxin system PIN domain toxin